MSATKIQVFLSSRFGEFAEYRNEIVKHIDALKVGDIFGLEVLDYGDGHARHRPPQEVCPAGARQSEFMILLLGDTYGELAPGTDVSQTHLEYREATAPGSNTWVIPAIISEHSREHWGEHPLPEGATRFRDEVIQRHTVSIFVKSEDPRAVASSIVMSLQKEVAQWMRGAPDPDDESIEAEARSTIDVGQVDDLERGQLAKFQRAEPDYPYRATQGPVSEAADEHRRLAAAARLEGEPDVARRHIEQSLLCKPLQPKVQYELAMLYLGRPSTRQQLVVAERHLAQSARWFDRQQLPFWRSACLIGLARVQLALGRTLAVGTCEQALAPPQGYAHSFEFRAARFEYARVLSLVGQRDKALRELDTLGRYSPRYLAQASRDIAFGEIRAQINERLAEQKQRMGKVAEYLRETHEQRMGIKSSIGALLPEFPAANPIPALDSEFDGLTATRMQQTLRRHFDELATWLTRAGQAIAEEAARAQLPGCLFPGKVHEQAFQLTGPCTIDRWLVHPGDAVGPGTALFEYRSAQNTEAKTYSAGPRVHSGCTMLRRLAPAGSSLEKGQLLCELVAGTAGASVLLKVRRQVETGEAVLAANQLVSSTDRTMAWAASLIGPVAVVLLIARAGGSWGVIATAAVGVVAAVWSLWWYRHRGLAEQRALIGALVDAERKKEKTILANLQRLWRAWVGTLQGFESFLDEVPREAVPFARRPHPGQGAGQLALLRNPLPEEVLRVSGPFEGDGRVALYWVARHGDGTLTLQRAHLAAVPLL